MKKEKPKYREKGYNIDTLEVNAIQTSRALGVHAPKPVDLSKLKRKERG